MHAIKEQISTLTQEYGSQRDSLLPILQQYTKDNKYLTLEAIDQIAKRLDMSAAQVYGVATFYSFIETQPRGKYIIRLCKTITCDMKGKQAILQTIENLLQITVGETTTDNKFSLLETNCLGQCHKGPAMLINDRVYTDLDDEKVTEIINNYLVK